MRYDTVIFDLDGTLLDTLEDLCDSVNHALRRFGLPERPAEAVRASLGYGSAELIARCIPDGRDNPLYQAVFDCYFDWYQAHADLKTRPYPGIPTLLRRLGEAGLCCAIVSNKPHPAAAALATRYFDGLVRIAVGEKPGIRRKPAPDMLLAAMAELGAQPARSVYVGDSEVDLQTARNAGVDCVAVLWGFRSRAELEAQGADRLAADAQALWRQLCAP